MTKSSYIVTITYPSGLRIAARKRTWPQVARLLAVAPTPRPSFPFSLTRPAIPKGVTVYTVAKTPKVED